MSTILSALIKTVGLFKTEASQTLGAHVLSAPAKCTGGYKVSVNLADGATAPGLSSLQHLINIVAVVTLACCALSAFGGGAAITAGKFFGFYQAGQIGRVMIIAGLLVAFFIGLAATLINVMYTYGVNGSGC